MKREKYNLTVSSVDVNKFELWLKKRTEEGKITGKDGVTTNSNWPVKFKYLVNRAVDLEANYDVINEEKKKLGDLVLRADSSAKQIEAERERIKNEALEFVKKVEGR
jgi:hypothetical protein